MEQLTIDNDIDTDMQQNNRIANIRAALGTLICAKDNSRLIGIVGPCALTNDHGAIKKEAEELDKLNSAHSNLLGLHRLPPWKPRTNPEDWHGLETTELSATIDLLGTRAESNSNLAIEIGMEDHIERYLPLISFGWIGGRNVANSGLIRKLANSDPTLPIGVKNGLDGEVNLALKQVKMINEMRENKSSILIYRGGENALDPTTWEKKYLEAFEATKGKLIVDAAHGSEMAHGVNFHKSEEGQIRALDHILELANKGYAPRGLMIEASFATSPTDPVIDFNLAVEYVAKLSSSVQ